MKVYEIQTIILLVNGENTQIMNMRMRFWKNFKDDETKHHERKGQIIKLGNRSENRCNTVNMLVFFILFDEKIKLKM